MDKKNCKTGKRTKRQVEKILMVNDVKREIIDILQITNRRFMYNPQTGTLILGDEMYGKSICSSHAQEFHASQAEGRFDDYLRGWIGVSKSYPHGIVHFAPAVSMEQFDCGFDALQMFAGLEGWAIWRLPLFKIPARSKLAINGNRAYGNTIGGGHDIRL